MATESTFPTLPLPLPLSLLFSSPCAGPFFSLVSSSQATMSRNGKGPKLELKLNLSRGNTSRRMTEEDQDDVNDVSPNFSSSPSSCVSSEAANSPEATSMVLAGCPRCLMYVMLAEEDPRCPKCKSTVLLDFLSNNNNNNGKNKKS